MPLSRGCIYVYNHDFQTSSSLKPNWPINAKFHANPPWEVGMKVYINGTGHIPKMSAMPIYGKNLKNLPQNQKSYDLET